MRKKIAVFDFDGTITKTDTLFAFIIHARGVFYLLGALLLYSPLILISFLGFYEKGRIKESAFKFLFEGYNINYFNSLCTSFGRSYCSKNLRPKAVDKIHELEHEGIEVFVVTASIANWVSPIITSLGIKPTNLIATEISVDSNGNLTGSFSTPNCKGDEKVRRLELRLGGEREDYFIIAFGDSGGDRALLSYADQSYYQFF